MKTLEKLRKNAFWTLDFLRGSRVRNHFNDIQQIVENYSSAESTRRRADRLQSVLEHAATTTPYYNTARRFKDLGDFPVINKNIIRDRFEEFRSGPYRAKRFFTAVTSGSTGTPFRIYQDENKKCRNTADTLYFLKRAGFELGSPLVYLKVWNEINRKPGLQSWIWNIQAHDVTHMSDEAIASLIGAMERDGSTKGMLGYASAYEAICRYLDQHPSKPLDCRVRSIIAMSESLNEYVKTSMAKYFSAPVVSRYSNLENGILAQQCHENGNEFHINGASYAVELLDFDKDVPVQSGMPGRIVITDLFNYAMPMIRYDTGDIGIFSEEAKCSLKTPVFTRVEGRRVDSIYDTRGVLLSPHMVTNNMWKYGELKQYQFIQSGPRDYMFKLNAGPEFNREEQLIREFRGYLGEDAAIRIEYVDEIPLLASGKRKKVLSTWTSR